MLQARPLVHGAIALTLALSAVPLTVMAQGTTFTQIQRGLYLSRAGDCVSCHTAPGGKPFAGGFPVPTPFGDIYSTNITPDPETGIGNWSNEDFYNAMHFGVRPDGAHLYPAFPYPWFTKMSRDDVNAIKAYLDTTEAVRQENKPTELWGPLSWRGAIAGWKLLFFTPGEFQPNPDKSDLWNRGAYLVDGAGHCAACHTEKNLLGAIKSDRDLLGGDAGDSWFAPSLSKAHRDGIGSWNTDEIIQYLKTGTNNKSATAGPMTEVVMNSTQYLKVHDLRAIATYLQDLPQDPVNEKSSPSGPHAVSENAVDPHVLERGLALYMDNCIGCHMVNGEGLKNTFPPLKGNPSVQARNADSLIHVTLAGARMATPQTLPTGFAMPSFAWKLSNAEVADLMNYVRNAWGNRAPLVNEDTVAEVREDVRAAGATDQGAFNSPY